MTATDPTGAVGYAFGEVLPSADMTTIANQQPDLWDAANGGAYGSLANPITLSGDNITLGAGADVVSIAGIATFSGTSATFNNLATFESTVFLDGDAAIVRYRTDKNLGDTAENFGEANDVWIVDVAFTSNRIYTIDNSSLVGARTRLVRRVSSNNSLLVQRTNATALITFNANAATPIAWADFVNTATDTWEVCGWSGDEGGVQTTSNIHGT